MPRKKAAAPTTNVLRRRRAFTALIPLVDGYWKRVDLLKERGWFSFEPYWKFRQSLCTPEEWKLHQAFLVEGQKEALGEYKSDLLEELRRQQPARNDETPLTACGRAHSSLSTTPQYEIAWAPFKRQQLQLRIEESKRHVRGLARDTTDDEQVRRIRIWTAVVEEMLGPLGFSSISKKLSPIFRAKLTEGWDVVIGADVSALGFETSKTVAKSPPGRDRYPIGQQVTWMALAPRARSTIHPSDPEMLFVPQYFLPYDRAYTAFWDLDGLELNVRAEMAGRNILWPEMLPRLIEAVSRVG